MSKKYCYVISYDERAGFWDIDLTLENERFKYGTNYNHIKKKWEDEEEGDAMQELLTSQVLDLIERLNKLETPKEGN